MSPRRLLVIEHEADAPVALFGEWLTGVGVELEVIRPWKGDPVPSQVATGGLVVLGGAMAAEDDDVAPWLPAVRSLLREAVPAGVPTLGICLGLQLLALGRGASTYKLKFGHRGQNKTVVFPDGRAMIVSENHGYAVDPRSLGPGGLRVWGTNPDDGTLEGLRDARGTTIALQGHPEGHPGPQEAGFVFDLFVRKVKRRT